MLQVVHGLVAAGFINNSFNWPTAIIITVAAGLLAAGTGRRSR